MCCAFLSRWASGSRSPKSYQGLMSVVERRKRTCPYLGRLVRRYCVAWHQFRQLCIQGVTRCTWHSQGATVPMVYSCDALSVLVLLYMFCWEEFGSFFSRWVWQSQFWHRHEYEKHSLFHIEEQAAPPPLLLPICVYIWHMYIHMCHMCMYIS